MQIFQDVFVSYGRRDSLELASRLNRRLVDLGFTVWFDYDDIPLGVDYQKQIDDAIERADNFLFIISPHSVNSPYCRLELEWALKYHKRIIPLLHVERISYDTWLERYPEGTEAAWAEYQGQGLHDHFQNMHPTLRKINWVYARERRDDFETALIGLLNIFNRQKVYVHQHTLLLAKALEWERNQKRSPYLLIGEDRLQAEAWLNIRFKDSQPPCLPTPLHCEFITESRKNADNLMTEVFLAYVEENRATAEQIRNSLRREGFSVWTNTTDIQVGAEFQAVIDQGIEETDNVVYLLSPAAVQSSWCQHELYYALSLHKRIIPVLVETTAPDQIPASIRTLKYIDLTDKEQESDYQLDEGQLLQVLRWDATYHNTHKRLLAKALKWERQHRNPTLLLRGYNLQQADAWLKLAKQMPAYAALPLQEALIEASLRQPPGISLDVFISYSRADSGFARKLNEALQLQGKRTWFDQESIAAGTADFQQEIHRGIESANTFLFILSPRSVNSPYCADEVEYAANLNKRLVTLLHQPIDPATLHPELARVQWLDFAQREDDFCANLTELMRILDKDPEHLQTHTRMLLQAIEWNSKGRNIDLLLRGSELEAAVQWLVYSADKEPKVTQLQQEYIDYSRKAELSQQEAEVHRQRLEIERQKRARKQITSALVVAVSCLVVATGLGLVAFDQYQKAEARRKQAETIQESQINSLSSYSSALHDLGYNWQALLEGLRASQPFSFQHVSLGTQIRVSAALQQALASVAERNQYTGHTDRVTSIRFSPRGTLIASGSADKTIKLWTLDGKLVSTLSGHNGFILDIDFSPSGNTIASASSDNTAKLWTVEGKEIQTLKGHTDRIIAVSFSPDGKLIGTASADRTAKLWSLNGKILKILKHPATVTSIQFSSNNQLILTASKDGMAYLWDRSGQKLHTLRGHRFAINTARFSPDGNTIVTASDDKTVKLWTLDGNKLALPNPIKHTAEVKTADYSPNGKMIITASNDGSIGLWNNRGGQRLKTLKGHSEGVTGAVFSPDGRFIASAGADKTVRLWQTEAQGLVAFDRHSNSITSIAFSRDGKTIATASADRTVKLWNTSGQELRTLKGHTGAVYSVSFSPDGNEIATASADKTVILWRPNGEKIKILKGYTGTVYSVSFSPDGSVIATASDNGTVKLWDMHGKALKNLTGNNGSVYSVGFSPDGKIIVAADQDGRLTLWNRDGTQIKAFQAHEEPIFNVSFSPDGRSIASASRDTTVKLWDLNGHELQTLRGHTQPVMGVSFSPDGQLIATSSMDQSVKLWNLQGQELANLDGHSDAVNAVSFSPDVNRQILISGGTDGRAILWDFNVANLQRRSCEKIDPYLTTHPHVAEEFKVCQTSLTTAQKALLTYFQGRELATQGDIAAAIAKFTEAIRLDTSQTFEPPILAQQLAASGLVKHGRKQLQLGDAKQSVVNYFKAVTVDPTLEISASDWNDLCWEGSLKQQTKEVLSACDRAIQLEPHNLIWRDTRGLARTKLGDYPGAIQDFQSFINGSISTDGITGDDAEIERAKTRRKKWIQDLKAGKDPFTPEEIQFLVDEKI